ncbi:MAG: sigma-54-dependent Fis family transcriptional regulator, partial [Deltaproteobacteria bacterium]
IEAEHLPSELAAGGGESAYLKLPYGLPLREIEKEYILATLTRLQNNKARTAQALGISEKTLYNKLYRYSGRGPRRDDDSDDDVETSAPPEIKVTGIG